MNFAAARNQAAAFDEEAEAVEEPDEDNPQETQKVEFDDKMGAKVKFNINCLKPVFTF